MSMSNLEKAIEVAVKAHAGQVDKGGQPYILHPLRVMMSVEGETAKIAAVLHDVIEDTAMTLGNLRGFGIPDEVIEAVDVLTRRRGESRLDAARRIVTNPVATQVKLADLKDNMDLSRIPNPTDSDLARLKEYQVVESFIRSFGAPR